MTDATDFDETYRRVYRLAESAALSRLDDATHEAFMAGARRGVALALAAVLGLWCVAWGMARRWG